MAVQSRKAKLESLQGKVEVACGQMRRDADKLDAIAEDLPGKRKDEAAKLRRLSDRLRRLSDSLDLEVQAGDMRTVSLLAKACGFVAISVLSGAVSGVAQGAGTAGYNHLVGSGQTIEMLADIERQATTISESSDPWASSEPPSPDEGFSGTRTAQIVGITYRQLDFWARTELVRPALVDQSGSGSRRVYSYQDLLELRMIKDLLNSGIKLEAVRDVLNYLRQQVGTDISTAHLVISGSQILLCDRDELIDAVRQGQGVLNVIPLASVQAEVDAAVAELKTRRERSARAQKVS
jgi:DNA-binding transcriptional MerR regulator